MNENEFRTRYAASQSPVEASPELKQRAVCNALQEGTAQHAGSQAPAKGAAPAKRPARRRPRPTSRTAGFSVGAASLARRWAPAAAACLVAGALAVAGIPALTSSLSGSPAITLDEAAARCGFSVRAYASDGSAPLAPGEGGTVAFDRDLGYRFRGGDDYKVSGFFSGCLFHVEGEGIVRVQAHLTGGALYRVTFEDGPTDPDDPRMGELASWKPTSRGTGEYYGGYDFVGSAMRDGESKLSLAKLMGATIDVSADDDPGIADGTTSFGLWTNEGEVPEDVFNDSQSPVIDLFDGQTLTVTVTFEDGSTSTQAIELHVANFETEMVDGAPRLTPRLAADDAEASTSAKSLYGTVVEAGNGPFPFPLDDANDRADEVLPASIIERQDDTWRATVEVDGAHVDATLPENALTAADGEIPFDFGYENPDYSYTNAESPQRLTAQLAMSSPSLSLSDTLPGGKTLGDCLFVIGGWLGNARYLDKCSREVWGYGYNDDGTLTSNDYRYASTTVTVRNLGDTAVPVWTSVLYEFALRNDDGTLDVVRTGYDLDFEASGDTLPSDNPQHVVIAPGGTVQLTMVRVLPTYVLESDNLVLVPTDNGSLFSHAFALGRQM
ncbi:MAG: hypothetical protein KH015_06875 [Gordonibacter pamelaeae]|uniref:Uncharacterized protein n=4 Tax=Gordonibacter pamelaeae TaxID=471189 RepID=A0A369M1K6_9ACTN|nr:hypothetical protein [Gordonibacter pamelaeae]MBS4895488.1 hypothetical protein [Gordonibacter pamelaeae]MCB6311836.1 hypothetical protein [Gordonibacter pamelaeae]RDB65641.1 hypothetical protein C1877_05840 [Gordonibacter pamelaeae]HJH74770.1 hypothetical protein [Eggerthellaceae bacterium]